MMSDGIGGGASPQVFKCALLCFQEFTEASTCRTTANTVVQAGGGGAWTDRTTAVHTFCLRNKQTAMETPRRRR